MLTIAALLAATQGPVADADALRWRRFVRTAAVTQTRFSNRISELHKSVRLLPSGRPDSEPRRVGGPSGL
jgi:hypothetical protein